MDNVPDIPPRAMLLAQISNVAATDWSSSVGVILVLLILLSLSALFSASENALFSLGPNTLKLLKESEDETSNIILQLLYRHKRLLAVILISNNFVNVAIVFLSTTFIQQFFPQMMVHPILGFVVQAGAVTLVLLLLGEILPKIYATVNALKVARLMARPLMFLSKVLWPLVYLLENTSNLLEKRMVQKGHQLSIDELNQAIDITAENNSNGDDEKEILKGIVNFAHTPVKQVMKSRMAVVGLSYHLSFQEVLAAVKEWGYSRLPVYEDNLDNVKGILSIKDLVPHLKSIDFDWHTVIRSAYFVPETKKLDDLMSEFQEKRVHMAIVVDEYGGTSGIVTMEDLLEEIFGDIRDEFDEEDFSYSQVDEYTYLFEGSILLNDLCRVTELEQNVFDQVRGDADTLAGMLIELEGRIPPVGSRVKVNAIEFIVESADRRKIKRVRVKLPIENNHEENN